MVAEASLPDALRSLREARGLSLGAAARRAGVALSTLHGWEDGRRNPKGPALERVLDALSASSRERARLLAATDPRHARVALAHTPLGPPVDVGMVVRAMRARRGVTQAELARSLGVAQGTVAKWESGDSAPSAQTIHAVGFALGASPEEILALASAQGGVPDGPLDGPVPPDLQEIVLLGREAELWRRAARDPKWEPRLVETMGSRACALRFHDDRVAEATTLARQALRLARRDGAWNEATAAALALAFAPPRTRAKHLDDLRWLEGYGRRLHDPRRRAQIACSAYSMVLSDVSLNAAIRGLRDAQETLAGLEGGEAALVSFLMAKTYYRAGRMDEGDHQRERLSRELTGPLWTFAVHRPYLEGRLRVGGQPTASELEALDALRPAIAAASPKTRRELRDWDRLYHGYGRGLRGARLDARLNGYSP